jgi:TatA/E family protein of Tat protein translocase
MNLPLALGMPGPAEWMFIMVIVVLLFGAKKLPELARGLGQSLGEFKKAREEFEKEIHKTAEVVETKKDPVNVTPAVTEPADKQPHQPS